MLKKIQYSLATIHLQRRQAVGEFNSNFALMAPINCHKKQNLTNLATTRQQIDD